MKKQKLAKKINRSFKSNPPNIYLFKLNNGNDRIMFEQNQWHLSVVFIANFLQISPIVLMFQLLTLSK